MICYFLSNTSTKNYYNWIVYVKIIASQRWGVFWDTVYVSTYWRNVDLCWKDFWNDKVFLVVLRVLHTLVNVNRARGGTGQSSTAHNKSWFTLHVSTSDSCSSLQTWYSNVSYCNCVISCCNLHCCDELCQPCTGQSLE